MKATKNPLWLAALSLGWLVACPPSDQECFNNTDCKAGEVCNVNGACRAAFVAEPRDASYHDLWYLDHWAPDFAAGDSALDAGAQDGQLSDSMADAGPGQVVSFSVCSGPSALAVSDDASELYVACLDDDSVKVYDSVSGSLIRDLNGLVSDCSPKSMLLREDKNQLWLSCSTGTQGVYCVNPNTGNNIQAPIIDTSTAPWARLASAGDRIAWVSVGGNNFDLQRLTSSGSASVVEGTVLGGSDVAINASADLLFALQINNQNGAIRRLDGEGGALTEIYSVIAQARFICAPPVNSGSLNRPILVASNQQFLRLAEDGVSFGSVETVTAGLNQALTAKADGSAFFLGSYDATQSKSWITQVSSDPSSAQASLGEQQVDGCDLSALAAASDGRVFAACRDSDRVDILHF